MGNFRLEAEKTAIDDITVQLLRDRTNIDLGRGMAQLCVESYTKDHPPDADEADYKAVLDGDALYLYIL